MAGDTRERILTAAVACVGRSGFARTSLDAIASRAGVSRATIYRHFPEGKEQLFEESIAHEVARYFTTLAAHVETERGLARRLEVGLPFAHRALVDHEVFQRVMETEPERLLPHLSTSIPLITDALRAYLAPLLAEEELTPGTDVDEAADYLARMILTFIRGQGTWDLDDPAQVSALVRRHLLVGILRDPGAV